MSLKDKNSLINFKLDILIHVTITQFRESSNYIHNHYKKFVYHVVGNLKLELSVTNGSEGPKFVKGSPYENSYVHIYVTLNYLVSSVDLI